MDYIWHAAILQTKFSATLQAAIEVLLHHRLPEPSDERSRNRNLRLCVMKALYSESFNTVPREPPELLTEDIPESAISIQIRTMSGHTYSVFLDVMATIDDLKDVIHYNTGINKHRLRLSLRGKTINPRQIHDGTLSDHGVVSGSLLYLGGVAC